MANVNAKYGLALHEDSNPNGGMMICVIPSGNATATFIGDAVKLADLDSIKINGGPYAPAVIQAAATDPIFGVVMGFQQHTVASSMDLGRRHRPASVSMYCEVKLANSLDIYRIQADDVGTTLTVASIGANADITVGSGDTVTGLSAMELDSSTVAATAGLQLNIVGFVDKPSNTPGAVNQDVLVRINQSQTVYDVGNAGVAN